MSHNDDELLAEFWKYIGERQTASLPVHQTGKYLDHQGTLVDTPTRRRRLRRRSATEELGEEQSPRDVTSREVPERLPVRTVPCPAIRPELRSPPAGPGRGWRCIPTTCVSTKPAHRSPAGMSGGW